MQDYNTIIGSIQMRLNGCQTRSVMDRYKIGSGTLNLIMSRYHANGIPIEELRMMAPKEVENLFYPQKNLQRKDVPLPDFQYYYDVSAKYCYAAHESRLHQNDRCKRFTLCLVLTVRFRSLAPWGKLFQLFI